MSFISKLLVSILLFVNVSLLVGCVQKDPDVALKKEFWNEQPKQLTTVALDKSAKADLYINGPMGLLDLAIIGAATKQFRGYLEQYDLSNFNALQTEFIENLHKNKIPTEKYDGSIEVSKLQKSPTSDYITFERKDFRSLSISLKNNQLLLLNINSIGAARHYSGMIPLEAPKALCEAEGRLVDLKSNKTLWRFSTRQEVAVDGKWDQPPQYPNFTQALNKAVIQAKQAIINDFFSSAPNGIDPGAKSMIQTSKISDLHISQ